MTRLPSGQNEFAGMRFNRGRDKIRDQLITQFLDDLNTAYEFVETSSKYNSNIRNDFKSFFDEIGAFLYFFVKILSLHKVQLLTTTIWDSLFVMIREMM